MMELLGVELSLEIGPGVPDLLWGTVVKWKHDVSLADQIGPVFTGSGIRMEVFHL